MKHTTRLSMSLLVVAACGGKQPAPPPPKDPEPAAASAEPQAEPAPAPEPEPEPPPPPPAPKGWRAHAQLNPLKGARIKGALVTFAQQDGQPVSVGSTGWFDGIRPGKYHLVVHEGAACGPGASKVGKPRAGGDIPFTAAHGMEGLDIPQVNAIELDGATAITGHVLVLHEDRRGKPGKSLACGPISATD